MAIVKNGRQLREDREKMLLLKHKYENRITITKFGKEALDNRDFSTALTRFNEYLQIMAEVSKVKDLFALKPSHFDPKREVTEMLMISHVFFEMAKIYDAIPKYHADSKKCLDQFVLFSANQPYQVVNSELIRKHMKKAVLKQPEAFKNSYEQIYVQSKKCYVVTFCYGDDHQVTQDYRALKDLLLNYDLGQNLVRLYYNYSSVAVERWSNNKFMQHFAQMLIRPLLSLFSKTVLRFIIKKC